MVSRVTKEYIFDSSAGNTGRYRDKATGRFVSQATVNNALEAQITASRQNIQRITENLALGNTGVAEWQAQMRDEMKTIHTASGVLAKGGWASMTPADWGKVGSISRQQYKYLDNFANEIYDGKVPLTKLDGTVNGYLLRRADLYAQAGAGTYNETKQNIAAANGADSVRRVLDDRAKHCQCCIDQAALGWVSMNDSRLLPIGSCTCVTNCRCTKEFGNSAEIKAAGGTVQPEPAPEQPKTEAQIIAERGAKYDPMRQYLPRKDDFTQEYFEALEEKKLTQQTFEAYEGELQDIQRKVDFEYDVSRLAKEYQMNPAQMTPDDWAKLAERVKEDAGRELQLATDPQRIAAANVQAGRVFIGHRAEKTYIQVGGKTITQQWAGATRKTAREALKQINAQTRDKATDYMQSQLVEMGYTQAQVQDIGYTSSRRLLAEIGNSATLPAKKINGISKAQRAQVVDAATDQARLSAKSIAYNPRTGRGLDLWTQYENAMIKAQREQAIEYPPELVESVIPDFVKFPGGKKPVTAYEPSNFDTSPIDF